MHNQPFYVFINLSEIMEWFGPLILLWEGEGNGQDIICELKLKHSISTLKVNDNDKDFENLARFVSLMEDMCMLDGDYNSHEEDNKDETTFCGSRNG